MANFASKHFLEVDENKKKDFLNNLLWNCKIENNEIAKISYKIPYSLMEKVPNKGTFLDLLTYKDCFRTFNWLEDCPNYGLIDDLLLL